METLILVFATIFGLIIGSFLNVCIYRIPRNKSIVWPPSGCPKCGKHIAFYDNIPLLSYLILWGKCRHCKAPISCQYPIVEFITGALTLLFVWHWGLTPWTAVLLTAVYCLIILSVIDLELMIIPDRFSLGLIVLGLATFALNPNFAGTLLDRFLQSLLGAGVGFFGTLAVALLGYVMFKKEAMGGGDVKLMGGIGAFVGWEGVITTIIFASALGLVYSVFLMIFKGKGKGDAIPFGPFLSAGALINMYYLIVPEMLTIDFSK
ncbi:MAG: prepilin peptidase [Elusimicrobiaceae bacterium]|nr:prepilin peptidase [Elusimicrobiaceae bacterium]